MRFADRPQTIRSRKAERAISCWLQQRGWRVLAAYDYSGLSDDKPPRLEGTPKSLVVPDLLTARKKLCFWIEVKCKTEASYTYITGRMETGLNFRLWDHYQQVMNETGIPVWIFFVHDEEDEIRGHRIDYLQAASCDHGTSRIPIFRESHSNAMGYMVFFCWDCLLPIALTSEVLPPE